MQILKSIAPIKKSLQIIKKKKKTTAIMKINIENKSPGKKRNQHFNYSIQQEEQLIQKKSHVVLEYVFVH